MDERFGFIHEKLDIKILILFVLQHLSEPVALNTLAELTLCDGGISYFDFTECVAELEKTEHIKDQNDQISITEKGLENIKITENSIPYSVRMKADKSASQLRARQNRNAMIRTSSLQRDNGSYTVSLSMADGIDHVISIELLVGSDEQAKAVEEGFRRNAEKITNRLIQIILEK